MQIIKEVNMADIKKEQEREELHNDNTNITEINY